MKKIIGLFVPNSRINSSTNSLLWLVWIAIFFGVWQFFPSYVLPRPMEVFTSFVKMWNQGLVVHVWESFKLQLLAMGLSLVISLVLAYLARIPFFKPLIVFISNLRFISVAPLIVFFTLLISSDGDTIKVWLLVFSISVFYITSMLKEVIDIPQEEFDHARTLKLNEWGVLWEVVIYGRLHIALELFRQNVAMGWMMITMVEGIVRSSSGIGNLLLVRQKFFDLSEIIVIIIILFVIGILSDKILSFTIETLFPYSKLKIKR